MQVVKCDRPILDVFRDIERAYQYTSEKTSDKKETFDRSFGELFSLYKRYNDQRYPVKYINAGYKPIEVGSLDNTVVVCFSGGKDSVATALWYKKRGYEVHLYHLRGINQTYHDEWKSAKACAEELGLPLHIEQISLTGQHEYTEHPMKNMIIANYALQWAIDNKKGYNIAFGNYYTSSLEDDPFEVCGGDCSEMWGAYERIIQTIIPEFQLHTVLDNMWKSLKCIKKNIDLLPKIQSCIGPYRYREYLHSQNSKKYGIELLPHRCGSCWKDAVEYIYFTDRGVLEYNRGFYRHCLEILKKTLKREEDIHCSNLETVFGIYFPSADISESKYFQEEQV